MYVVECRYRYALVKMDLGGNQENSKVIECQKETPWNIEIARCNHCLPLPTVNLLSSLVEDLTHAHTITALPVLVADSLPTLFECGSIAFGSPGETFNVICPLVETLPFIATVCSILSATPFGQFLLCLFRQSDKVGLFVGGTLCLAR